MEPKKIAEGKTKIIFLNPDFPGTCDIEEKDFVTWKNKYKEPLAGKGVLANVASCNLFRILKARGRNTAYVQQAGSSTRRCLLCDMVKFEAVARFVNREEGSYRKQYPNVPVGPLAEPVVQLFLKTEKGQFGLMDLSALGDDPLIVEVEANGVWVQAADQEVGVATRVFVPYVPVGFEGDLRVLAEMVEDAVLADATVLHEAFRPWYLDDIKIEYGIVVEERRVPRAFLLVAADSIDPDSFRLRDENGVEQSKQRVRNENSVEHALAYYQAVAQRTTEMFNRTLRV